MFKSTSELLASITPVEKSFFYNMLSEAVSLSKGYYIDMRPEFQDPLFCAESETRMIGTSIQSVFSSTKRPGGFTFDLVKERTNDFGHYVCRFANEFITIHVGKVLKHGMLPYPSKYRLRCAKANCFPDGDKQIEMHFRGGDVHLSEERQYAMLLYGLDADKSLSFLELAVPDESIGRILNAEDLKQYERLPLRALPELASKSRNATVVKSKRQRKSGENGENI